MKTQNGAEDGNLFGANIKVFSADCYHTIKPQIKPLTMDHPGHVWRVIKQIMHTDKMQQQTVHTYP